MKHKGTAEEEEKEEEVKSMRRRKRMLNHKTHACFASHP